MLSVFIRTHLEAIIGDWEAFAATLRPAALGLSAEELRNSAADILNAVADDMESPQTAAERLRKSHGLGEGDNGIDHTARRHAGERLAELFTLNQLVAEYRALRASVVRHWMSSEWDGSTEVEQLLRFDEAIDQSLTEAIAWYEARNERNRDLFIGLLGHDLREPLATVMQSAEVLRHREVDDEQRLAIADRLLRSARWMVRLTDDLLGFARLRFGSGIPLETRETDLADLCRRVIFELKSDHPTTVIRASLPRRLAGHWDPARLAQLLTNLLVNAIRHGDGAGIRLEAGEEDDSVDDSVWITVHNAGPPIPAAQLREIFQPFVSNGAGDGPAHRSHGLGLHISQRIVEAHNGTIEARSSEADGTVLTVRLPKSSRSTSAA